MEIKAQLSPGAAYEVRPSPSTQLNAAFGLCLSQEAQAHVGEEYERMENFEYLREKCFALCIRQALVCI